MDENIDLSKIIRNTDITEKLSVCKNENKDETCILYIKNTTQYDALAGDYFGKASELTGRNRYLISTVNPVYSGSLIPPGKFAQIKIPSINLSLKDMKIMTPLNVDLNTLITKNPDRERVWEFSHKLLRLCTKDSYSNPCVIYIMNTSTNEKEGYSFLKEISDFPFNFNASYYTNDFSVPPGHIAEIILIPTKSTMIEEKHYKNLIEQYIIKRFEVYTKKEIERNWRGDGFVFNTSTQEVYKQFYNTEAVPLLNLISKEPFIRRVQVLDLKEETSQNWIAIIQIDDVFLDKNEHNSSKWSLKIKLCDDLVCKFEREKYQEQDKIKVKN